MKCLGILVTVNVHMGKLKEEPFSIVIIMIYIHPCQKVTEEIKRFYTTLENIRASHMNDK